MALAAVCSTCGAKVRAGRARCPRCRAILAAPDPAIAAARSRQLARASAVLIGLFVVAVAVLWFMREPAPVARASSAVVNPLAGGGQATEPPEVDATGAAAATEEEKERPFLEQRGAGGVAYASGDYASSLENYMAAVERNPQDAESLSNLGQVLVRLERPAEAIPYYERAIALIPDRWAYHFNLARALGLTGRMDESIAAYRRAQQLFPDDYATAFNLALTLHKKGDEAAAVEEYQRTIALEPEDASFRKALAISLEQLRRGPEAAAAYQEYLRLSPSAPDAEKVRARIALLTGSAATGAQPPVSGQ